MAATRQELVKNLSDLLDRIGSDAQYAPNASEYAALITTINNIIGETAAVLKARLTRDSNNDNLPESEQPEDIIEDDNSIKE